MLRILRGHQERRDQGGLEGNLKTFHRAGEQLVVGCVAGRYMFVEINKNDVSREQKAVDQLVCLGCKGESKCKIRLKMSAGNKS